MIMIVWVAARTLSSNIEYLSARLYNFSIVFGGFKDGDWKNGVDDPKLILSLEDRIHAVRFYLLNGLPKSPIAISNRFRFLLDNIL